MKNRTILMTALANIAREVRGGRYLVKRGYINWATWPFDQHPYAMSLMLDEHDLFGAEGMLTGKVSIECFMRIPEVVSPPQLEDATLEELITDVATVIERVSVARYPGDPDYPVAFAVLRKSARAVEAHDADLRVQGVTATFDVSF